MDGTAFEILGMFLITWGTILPLYLRIGRIEGYIKEIQESIE